MKNTDKVFVSGLWTLNIRPPPFRPTFKDQLLMATSSTVVVVMLLLSWSFNVVAGVFLILYRRRHQGQPTIQLRETRNASIGTETTQIGQIML